MKLPPGVKLLSAPSQVAAVSSPLRIELLEHLLLAGRSSVADLAALMGRPATALHYHVRVLHAAGIVRVAGQKRAGRRSEALYQLAATAFAVAGKPREKVGDAVRTLGATLRLAQRESGRAMRAGLAHQDGPLRSFHSRRLRAALSRSELRRANRLLDELEALFSLSVEEKIGERRVGDGHGRAAPAPADQMVSLTFVLTPSGIGRKTQSGTAGTARRRRGTTR